MFIKNHKINGKSYITLGEYAKKHNVPLLSVQSWVRQGQFDKQHLEKVARVQYVTVVLEDAKPNFVRRHPRRRFHEKQGD